MNHPSQPVPVEGFILRRIHRSQCDRRLPLPVLLAAFRPSKADTTGLSVYRATDVSPAELAAAGRKPGEYYVVRLPVRALHALNLTVITDDRTDGPPGHALIPELNLSAYERDKEAWKAVLVELGRLASQDIVHEPDS